MAKNDTENSKSGDRWVLKNIVKAVLFFAVLLLAVQLLLKFATRHGKEQEVPDFSNMPVAEAERLASRNDLRVEVIDSVFIKRMERGYVFSQKPEAGKKVKKGRRVMLTINATQSKTVRVPNVVGLSLRQAKTEIESNGLHVGKLIYQSDIATNNVLEQMHRGKAVRKGTELETDSVIDLVLGLSEEDSMTYIPYLIGYTYNVAKDNLHDNSLNVGKVRFDETVHTYQDSLNAVVYTQSPGYSAGAPCQMGTAVSISLTCSQAKISR